MRILRSGRRRTPGTTATATAHEQGKRPPVRPDKEPVGGWSTGAQANTTNLLRWAAWGLLVLGPFIGTMAYLAPPSQAGPAEPEPTSSAAPAAGGQGAAGFATLFVASWLSAGEGDQNKLAAYYPPAASLRFEGPSGRRHGEQLTVVRLRQTDHTVWSVTVAARVVPVRPASAKPSTEPGTAGSEKVSDGVRYFQVPVATAAGTQGATAYTALALPGEVTAPERAATPDLIYGPMRPALPSDPRTQAVTSFLTAYLTGVGAAELDRYLAPGTQLAPITPAPYKGIALDQLAIEGEQGSEPGVTVPGDGTTLRVLAVLRATEHDDVRVPLAYALTLNARAGRWEITSLDGAPTTASEAAAPAPASPGPVTPTN
ncbi:conjugal transfer protein [Streptomyces sp. NPDC001502]|uniref:conjugal transfer protein n=1 Tax=Streptomyces sp. NPDC001502 TaxID=3364578 RepID=UPI0036BCC247